MIVPVQVITWRYETLLHVGHLALLKVRKTTVILCIGQVLMLNWKNCK